MENISKFSYFWWKFFQLELIEKNPKNPKSWKENFEKVWKFVIFGFLVTNMMAFIVTLFLDFYTFPLTAERASLMFVVLVATFRSYVNYLILFTNQNKIKKVIKNLPEFHPLDEEIEFKITKKLKNSRFPSLIGFVFTFLPWIQKFVTLSLTAYRKELIGFEFEFIKNNWFLLGIYNLWPCLVIQMAAGIVIVYESLLYGILILLTVEFQKLKAKVDELKMEIHKISNHTQGLKCSRVLEIIQGLGMPGSARDLTNTDFNLKTSCLPKTLKNPQNLPKKSTEVLRKIHKIIDRQVEFFNIQDQLEAIFSPLCLSNLIFGSICLCMEELCSLIVQDVFLKAVLASVVLTQTSYFYIQCSYCQQLKDASLSISDAIYDCKWEEIEDVKVKMHLLMILMRSQRSKTLTCWKFAENSFELFGSVRIFFLNFFGIFCEFLQFICSLWHLIIRTLLYVDDFTANHKKRNSNNYYS